MSLSTPAECLDALRQLGGKDAYTIRDRLDAMLDALLQSVPPSRRHLEVLEAMRETLDKALATMAHSYGDHPVAPDDPEDKTLRKVVATWSKMGEAYAAIARDTALGNSATTHALLAQRRVDCASRALLEYMRARRAIPSGLWKNLHDTFVDAEARGFAYTRAYDPLNRAWQAQSAAEAHTTMLLVDLANPFARAAEEFDTTWECARYFAPYCRLLEEGSDADDGRRAAYGLDPGVDRGLRPVATLKSISGIRRFDSSQLPDQFRLTAARVRKGKSAVELGLAADFDAEEAVKLLLALYRPWARGSSGRRFARHGGGGHAELTGDWKAIAFYIAGKPFSQPAVHTSARSLSSDMRLLTLGEQVTRIDLDDNRAIQREAEHRGFICTQWEILDYSIGGFRLRRFGSTERLEHRELIAIRPGDGKSFMLGMVNWVMYREDGTLEAGIKLLDGVPKVVAVRSVGIVGQGNYDISFQQAFQLSETPALKSPATLVLPAGYFQPFRVIEMFDESLRGYRLLELVNRGADFDQATFEAISVAA